MKEVSQELSNCREEIRIYVESNTKLKEENDVLKGIMEPQDLLQKESDPEIVEVEMFQQTFG